MSKPHVSYVTTYSPSEESLGGASWVDRRIIDFLSAENDVDVIPIGSRTGRDGTIKLEIRRDPIAIGRTVARMVLLSEPYFPAKFRSAGNWRTQLRALEHRIRPNSLVVSSQLPALLALTEMNISVDLHVAHNVDTILSHAHDPRLFKVLRNTKRTELFEKQILSQPAAVAALSTRDVGRLRSWGIDAHHLPLVRDSEFRFQKDRRIGFLGKGSWPPNQIAIDHLLQDVMPRVRGVLGDDAPTVIIGGRDTERWANEPGVETVGVVPSAEKFYKTLDLVVVPRSGSVTGISIKMLEALESGVPVIVPNTLAEDAGIKNGVIAATTAEETAKRIIEYYQGDVTVSGDASPEQVGIPAQPTALIALLGLATRNHTNGGQ